MVAIQAVYDGNVFIPEKPCEIISGSKVSLTIETVSTGIYEKQKKLASLKQLSQELIDLNKTDPLPPEFDEILSERLHFRELASL
jgi:predicted DNA-binding antitoxin AbrB/MazE fold protein